MNQIRNLNPISKKNKIGYPLLFTPLQVGKYITPNRLVALPVHTGFAQIDGHVSSWMINFYTQLANSGPGIVIVANTAVSPDGVVSKFNLRADKDEFIPGLSKLAKAIKQTGAIACLQLNHAGRFAKVRQPLLPAPITSANLSFNMESLKGFMEFFPFEHRFSLTRDFIAQVKTWRRSMTSKDWKKVINDFADAAFRAYEAGFDMVELHGANGYLLCQYLSPFTNKIESGTIESYSVESGSGKDFTKRTAFPLAVVRAVKKKLPPDFPLGFRLLLQEWVPNGITLPEALAFAQFLEKEGIAYLSAAVSTYNSLFSPEVLKKMNQIAYLSHDMAKLTTRVNIPTIISGRITTPLCAENLLEKGITDLIGLGRPLRADPDWVRKAKDPDQKIIHCINCNWCLKQVVLEKGFNCSRWPRLMQKRTVLEHKLLTRNSRALWVITDLKDIQTFKNSLAFIVSQKKHESYPSILFLRKIMKDVNFDSAQQNFIKWTKNKLDPLGFSNIPRHYTIREPKENWEKIVRWEIIQGNHGQVFICSKQSQPWRQRLFYKLRGKVLVLLHPNYHLHRIMVPMDFSDVTLLVMIFLKQNLMKKKGFHFCFIHVTSTPSGHEEQQWKKLKKIVGFDENIPLQIIKAQTDVVSTLIKIIQTQKYGTIVMGKRGLGNIKRWLLGSVSAGVLRKLTDQSLFLID
jgi:2,4-dienoyl-CoA reductase-like NADH-dependent reductase (Old Yellow Enzyme family)